MLLCLTYRQMFTKSCLVAAPAGKSRATLFLPGPPGYQGEYFPGQLAVEKKENPRRHWWQQQEKEPHK